MPPLFQVRLRGWGSARWEKGKKKETSSGLFLYFFNQD
mgnify:FL=1|jgi:hypothetical protein